MASHGRTNRAHRRLAYQGWVSTADRRGAAVILGYRIKSFGGKKISFDAETVAMNGSGWSILGVSGVLQSC
jgi:hypothetical protein